MIGGVDEDWDAYRTVIQQFFVKTDIAICLQAAWDGYYEIRKFGIIIVEKTIGVWLL